MKQWRETETMTIDGLDRIELENTSIMEIDSENINLIFVGIDRSGSMGRFAQDMIKALTDFRDALQTSGEADEILVARADFAADVSVGGYKRIAEFDTSYDTGGCTALYDVVTLGTEKLKAYRDFLKKEGMRVRAVFAVFSDGRNTVGNNFAGARQALAYLKQEEITTAFVSFGGEAVQTANDLGFQNILDVGSSASELRKAFQCLSRSVIEYSKTVLPVGENFFEHMGNSSAFSI